MTTKRLNRESPSTKYHYNNQDHIGYRITQSQRLVQWTFPQHEHTRSCPPQRQQQQYDIY
jgi:hypothetical protein